MPDPLEVGQYVATDKDNVAVDPQPGDVEITDAFGNVFDNFNEYGVVTGADKDTAKNRLVAFYKSDNTLKDPQPAYQNLGYVQRYVNNTEHDPVWEPDAAQWQCRDVENQLRTPEKYVRSPLWPDGAPEWYDPIVGDGRQLQDITVVLTLEDNEALVVTEDDVNTIELTLTISQIRSIPAVSKYG